AQVVNLREGEKATVSLRVIDLKRIPIRKLGRSILEVRCTDDSGLLSLKWFHVPKGMDARFKPGTQFVATGSVKVYLGKKEIIHPEISWGVTSSSDIEAGHPHVGRVIPIYTEIEGIPTRFLRKILWEAIEKFGAGLTEDIPSRFLAAHQLPTLAHSIREIHFPTGNGEDIQKLLEFATAYHHRLIYEEFFKFEYLILKQRLKMERSLAPTFGDQTGTHALQELEAVLPFQLTRDQKSAIQDISADLSQPHPMNRLIQGDVGSGKTAVAFLTAGLVLAQGGQVALMAPTEILAEQHHRNALKLFGIKLNIGLLTGKTSASDRALILGRLISGEPLLLIGTHALIEDPVQFKNLCYIIIDEQHRFGVEQRRTLRKKGTHLDPVSGRLLLPHNLALSATPIPRTLALTAYGDLSQTLIKELPPGRSPIQTKVVRTKSDQGLSYQLIRKELTQGHQAYFIFPLVNDSEAEGFTELKSAVAEAERLSTEVFPEFKVGLLHGQMRPEDKAKVMSDYLSKKLHILVSTTVVEVGVDVPNATIMAIVHAERFGLSQ
ncbi:MAG: ATP-dependent DNA helicase RecG, partial [Bdellovibrionota bacterium]